MKEIEERILTFFLWSHFFKKPDFKCRISKFHHSESTESIESIELIESIDSIESIESIESLESKEQI